MGGGAHLFRSHGICGGPWMNHDSRFGVFKKTQETCIVHYWPMWRPNIAYVASMQHLHFGGVGTIKIKYWMLAVHGNLRSVEIYQSLREL